MATEVLGSEDWVRMIRAAAARIREHRDQLSELDAALGDGDHGTAMDRAMSAAEQAAEQNPTAAPGELLEAVGWAVMGAAGGATGPLLGCFFTGLGEACGEKTALTAPEVAAAFEAGLASLREQTPAEIGDKTMVDALVPAVEALRAAVDAGADIATALQAAAQAATAGAAGTADFVARYGRAHNLGERALGHPDPGATSLAHVLAAWAEAVE